MPGGLARLLNQYLTQCLAQIHNTVPPTSLKIALKGHRTVSYSICPNVESVARVLYNVCFNRNLTFSAPKI